MFGIRRGVLYEKLKEKTVEPLELKKSHIEKLCRRDTKLREKLTREEPLREILWARNEKGFKKKFDLIWKRHLKQKEE